MGSQDPSVVYDLGQTVSLPFVLVVLSFNLDDEAGCDGLGRGSLEKCETLSVRDFIGFISKEVSVALRMLTAPSLAPDRC